MENSLLTIAEVADLLAKSGLKVSPLKARKMAEDGDFEYVGDRKLFRVRRESLMKYINGHPQIAEKPPAGSSTTPVLATQTPQGEPLTPPGVVGKPEASVEPNGHEERPISEDGKKKLQDLIDATSLAKAEAAKILAEIARDEAMGKRDKPDILVKKEAESKELETSLAAREAGIREKEANQAKREIVLNDKQAQADKRRIDADAYFENRKKDADAKGQLAIDKCEEYAKQVRSEADEYAKKVKTEADEYLSTQKFEADNLNIDLTNSRNELKTIADKTDEAKKELAGIAQQVQAYLPQVVNRATQHYNTAMRSSGNTASFHHSQANRGWDLEDKLDKLLKQIGL